MATVPTRGADKDGDTRAVRWLMDASPLNHTPAEARRLGGEVCLFIDFANKLWLMDNDVNITRRERIFYLREWKWTIIKT